jgi:LCP family protein required for cell wall assembly
MMVMKPYTVYAVERRPAGRWRRAVLWTALAVIVVILVTAGGSYLWLGSQVWKANKRVDPEVASALSLQPPTTLAASAAGGTPVTAPESPRAMNILVLGSDHRPNEEDQGRSDTIIMVHVDPDQKYLSLLSLPRDLRVEIPGHGLDKLNAAYAFGGPSLTIRTVKQLTGVDIKHYVGVDFEAFKDITDALGGVYVDVDRRYYNDNAEWELIKLAPGYQLLRGDDALDYVRFRHDLNGDFGRMERQQRFLAAMREQAMGWNLPFKLPGLISALFSNISTDLSTNDILELAYWGICLDGNRIRQVSIMADTPTIGGISYVVASKRTIKEAVTAFVTAPGGGSGSGSSTSTSAAPGKDATTSTGVNAESAAAGPGVAGAPDLTGIEVEVLNGNGRSGEAAQAKEWLEGFGAQVASIGNARSSDQKITMVRYPRGDHNKAVLVARGLGATSLEESSRVARITAILGRDFAIPSRFDASPTPNTIPNAGEWKALATMIPFALQAPSYIPEGYSYYDRMPPKGSTFDIEVGRGTKPALKMIYRLKENGQKTDQYMGITETTWLDAPAASKGREFKVGGTTFTVVGTDRKVERVWWKANGVLYWVSNTLSYRLDREDMLKIAQSMIPIPRP